MGHLKIIYIRIISIRQNRYLFILGNFQEINNQEMKRRRLN